MLRFLAVVIAFVIVLIAGIVLACGGGGDGGNSSAGPTPVPTETPTGSGPAEQALARHVESTLQKPFVEDCTKADVSKDANKICAILRGERGTQRAYIIGPTFSEPSQWVIMEERAGQWVVAQTTGLTADTAAVPGVPWPLRIGVEVVVVGANPCVNVREGPTLNQKAVDCIRDGTKIRLTAGPVAADSINWWQVEGRSGWVSGDYLRFPDAAQ